MQQEVRRDGYVPGFGNQQLDGARLQHVNEKTSGSSPKPGEKKEADEMSASGATSKPSSMNPTETKAVKTEPEKSQSATPKSQPQHASDVGSKPTHSEKAASRSKEQLTSEKSTEPKAKSQATVSVEKESAVAGVAATSGKPDDKKKEKKSLMPAAPVESKPDKPPGKSGIDAALDDLIDTLGEPEETNEDNTTYTGPEISDPMYSTYIEELGKREITIPPKYRELLAKKGVMGPPPDSLKPMGPDDAIDALSSDFTCSSPTAGGEKTDKQDAMSDQAVEALSASLGTREPEPELDLSAVKEVDEAKAKEERLKKCGEDDETVPSEYRLKPAMTLSESELIDELSEDFNRSKCKEKQSKPTGKTEKSQAAATAPVAEVVSATSMCSVQMAPPKPASSKSTVPDDAVEALAGSLGKKEPDPEEGKPVVDKIKEKAREEDREKLGEKEETIPPDYRLEEVKDKDGKPLLPKEAKKPLPPLSDDFLLDALSRDFSSPADTSSLKFDDAKLSAVVSEVVSQTPASATHAAGPPPDTAKSDKELDDALDKLSDSLGQRQPDPDENKPMEDKVKEKAKAEHRDKLGERDDTIPPEYRHLLDGDGQNKPAKPPTKKSKESKKPADDKDPIDVLSGDLDSCPSTAEPSPNTAKDKNKKGASSSKAPKNESKAKDSAKKTEEASKPKGDEKNTKKDDDKKTS
ncbi:Calpastatin [Fukomys damarensis]|uniref:Calpastatin n=1 Tax=Fukomys damarensis TaxID=885580 RepID=A0A091EFY2_FUKDA|nr:Calpastatin [Fukomys damarensis]